MQENNSKDAKKIVLMGLDNSGKTSIVMCLKGVKNLSSFNTISPTRGFETINFSALGLEFNIWDFGGQQKLREGYLENFNDHIRGASKLIYVIDIQDEKRYDTALEYLAEIIKLLRKNKISLEFSLFLHKFDPDLEILKKEIKEEVLQPLLKQIDDIIPPDFQFAIYKTSIYTVFQKLAI